MEKTVHEKLPAGIDGEKEDLFAEIRRDFKGSAEELIPLLQKVQEALGFLPEDALLGIALFTGLAAAKVFGTATFYSQFRLKPVGRKMIRVCRGTACHVRGGAGVLKEVEKRLGIKPGESTEDLEFALETVACIGACALAPTMVIDNETHGEMTRKKVGETLYEKESKKEETQGQQ